MQNHRIYITRRIPQSGIGMLEEKGYEVIVGSDTEPLKPGKLNKILSKATKSGKPFDAVLCLLTDKIGTDILNFAPELKIVSNFAIGFDNIDVKGLAEKGVVSTNAPGNYCDSVAEHVLALTLSLVKNITTSDRYMRQGKFKGWDPNIFVGGDVSNKTVGLIGAGRIGEKVAYHFKKGFDTKIIYYDMNVNAKMEAEYGAQKMESVDELLKQADIVSLHVPLLPTTHHMVDEKFLRKMHPEAFLINTSRGPVVDEKVLVKALQEKWIAGAALDVFEFEPDLTKGLTKLENVVMTSHIASASEHARTEMAHIAAQNIIDVFEGRDPVGLIRA